NPVFAEQRLFRQAILRGGQCARVRKYRHASGQPARGFGGNVLEVECGHIDARGELLQRALVAVVAQHHRCELRGAGIGGAVHHQEAQAQRRAGKRDHAGQLPATEDADGGHLRGSSAAITSAVWRSRNAARALSMAASPGASIAAANSAALAAPALPMAKVATGIPAGICTIESSESMPLSALLCTGTPSTGTLVLAASMPGRCAAPPAPAMIARSPRDAALAAYSKSTSGVRCADTTRTSWATPSCSSRA